MNKLITIFDNIKPTMMFKKLTFFLVLFCVQNFVIAQDKPIYEKLKQEADSLAKLEEFAKSEAMYLKAIKVFNHDPILHINLASLYLKNKNILNAKKFLELAVYNGAEINTLLLDTSIKKYLEINPKEHAKYVSQSNQHKSLVQTKDKTSWIDDFRRTF